MRNIKIIFALSLMIVSGVVSAASIDGTHKWAWGNVLGWVNWNPTRAVVEVTDSKITGHVWSQNYGWINLSPANEGVTNTCGGNVGGYAWGQHVGWVNMNNVFVNPTTGLFSGTASTSNRGDMVFSGTNFYVQTDWRCNTLPEDTDGDGIPDVTEVANGTDPNDPNNPTAGGNNDTDGDGISNAVEQLIGSNASSTTITQDTDGDGIPDVTEVANGTDPNDPNNPTAGGNNDTDGDGISNAVESFLKIKGGAADTVSTTDTDGDGIPDVTEVANGTDPMNQGSPVQITQSNNGERVTGYGIVGATIDVTTPSGATCSTVVSSSGLWECLLNPVPEDGELVTVNQTGSLVSPSSASATIIYAGSPGGVASGGGGSGNSINAYVCKDEQAINYQRYGKKDNALCKYEADKDESEKVDVQNSDSVTNSSLPQEHQDDSGLLMEVCSPYLRETIQLGANNNPQEVDKLILFLNEHEDENLSLDGTYDQDDFEAVKRFQSKYSKSILEIWGLSEATGYVYVTTRMKINSFKCGKSLQCPVFKEFNGIKTNNNTLEVQRTKVFMKELGLYGGAIDTTYDIGISDAVKKFQESFAATMLHPWGLKKGTGYKYKTTNKFMNEMVGCSTDSITLENGVRIDY